MKRNGEGAAPGPASRRAQAGKRQTTDLSPWGDTAQGGLPHGPPTDKRPMTPAPSPRLSAAPPSAPSTTPGPAWRHRATGPEIPGSASPTIGVRFRPSTARPDRRDAYRQSIRTDVRCARGGVDRSQFAAGRRGGPDNVTGPQSGDLPPRRRGRRQEPARHPRPPGRRPRPTPRGLLLATRTSRPPGRRTGRLKRHASDPRRHCQRRAPQWDVASDATAPAAQSAVPSRESTIAVRSERRT